jgi:hypothetical protein
MAPVPPPDPSWYDAPRLLAIAASQQGGSRGAQVWGVTQDYGLTSIFQETPGGSWSGWSAPGWANAPAAVLQPAAAQQNDGRVQLWVIDDTQQLWSIWQTSPGGGWTGWSGPNWNGAPGQLDQLAACQQGGNRGAQLWATTDEDVLITTFQETPGGNWSSWNLQSFLNAPPTLAVCAAQQNDGRVQIWILDDKQQLWTAWQTSPGGNWTGWSGPSWNNAPILQTITASQQGGSRGAQLWGVDQDYALWTTYQETPGGNWSGWLGPSWAGATTFTQIAAAQQNNGCVELWGIDLNLSVKTISQTSPGGNWTGWSP